MNKLTEKEWEVLVHIAQYITSPGFMSPDEKWGAFTNKGRELILLDEEVKLLKKIA